MRVKEKPAGAAGTGTGKPTAASRASTVLWECWGLGSWAEPGTAGSVSTETVPPETVTQLRPARSLKKSAGTYMTPFSSMAGAASRGREVPMTGLPSSSWSVRAA